MAADLQVSEYQAFMAFESDWNCKEAASRETESPSVAAVTMFVMSELTLLNTALAREFGAADASPSNSPWTRETKAVVFCQ